MKKILSALLVLACLLSLLALPVTAEGVADVTLTRSTLSDNEAGQTTGAIYLRDEGGNVIQVLTYLQQNDMYTHHLKVYKLSSGKYFVEATQTLEGTASDYMLIRKGTAGFVVEKHINSTPQSGGATLTNVLSGEKLFEASVTEFYTGDIDQDQRNVLNTEFSIEGVVFTQDGVVVEAGSLAPLYELDDFQLVTLPESSDLPGATADLSAFSFGGDDLPFTDITADETATDTAEAADTAADETEETASASDETESSSSGSSGSSSGSVSSRSTAVSYTSMSERKVTTTASVNLRKGPGTSYKSLGSISKGTVLNATGKIGVDSRSVQWYQVKYDGKTGYVSSRYAVKGKKSIASSSSGTITTTGSAHIRAKANKSSKSLGTVSGNKYLTYLGKTSTDSRGVKWYKVAYDGEEGWISSKYAVQGKVKGGSSASSSSSSSGSKVKTTGSVTIRSKPDKTSKKLGYISTGKKVTYLGSSKKDSRGVRWYKIKYDGVTGWVSSKYSKLV